MKNAARGALLALALLAGTADAAIYVGNWDPAYGSPFTNLGWRGSANYFVPDSCEPVGTAVIPNSPNCSGMAAVTSAQVELYDVTAVGQPTIETLIFTPGSMSVVWLSYVGGQLTELDTSASSLVDPVTTSFGIGTSTLFFLQFTTLSGPRLGWIDTSSCEDRDFDECDGGFNDATNFPPRFTITEVPEPGSLALAALALLALVPARRRRRAGA